MNDSIKAIVTTQHDTGNQSISNNTDDVLGATLVATLLLFLVYVIKYAINEFSSKSLWEAVKEFPIDLNTIFITVFISFYYKLGTVNNLAMLIFCVLLGVSLCCVFRRCIKEINEDDGKTSIWWNLLCALFTLLEYAMPTLIALYVYNNKFFS